MAYHLQRLTYLTVDTYWIDSIDPTSLGFALQTNDGFCMSASFNRDWASYPKEAGDFSFPDRSTNRNRCKVKEIDGLKRLS